MEQPPNPTETPCKHATSRDISHSSSTDGVSFTSAASTEGNRGPVTETEVHCGSACGTCKHTARPMARSHSHNGTGDPHKSAGSSSKDMGLQVTDKVKTAGKRGSKETDNAHRGRKVS